MLRIPPFNRGRAPHASSADSPPRRMTFYRHSPREIFASPLPAPSRIAVFSGLFAEKRGVRCFEPESVAEVQTFDPHILAGSVHTLLRVAPVIRTLRAVVPFSGARVGEVTSRDRDLLWIAYQVPVFEQRFGTDGSIIARECEAHDGLHLVSPGIFRGPVRTDVCECGRPEPRIGF
jgi:hypothetical protein